MVAMKHEVHELKCDICGKVITSLNENQANYNMRSHKAKHDLYNESTSGETPATTSKKRLLLK